MFESASDLDLKKQDISKLEFRAYIFSVTATILGHKLRLMQGRGGTIGKWVLTFLSAKCLKHYETTSNHRNHQTHKEEIGEFS